MPQSQKSLVLITLAHGAAGRMDISMVRYLLTGSLPGVVLGSGLCYYLPSRPLRLSIATMVAVAG